MHSLVYMYYLLLLTLQLTNTYGNIYTLWMGQTPMVVLNGYRAVKDGIVTHSEEVSGRPLTPFYRDMMGEKGTRCHTILKYEQDVKKTGAFLLAWLNQDTYIYTHT